MYMWTREKDDEETKIIITKLSRLFDWSLHLPQTSLNIEKGQRLSYGSWNLTYWMRERVRWQIKNNKTTYYHHSIDIEGGRRKKWNEMKQLIGKPIIEWRSTCSFIRSIETSILVPKRLVLTDHNNNQWKKKCRQIDRWWGEWWWWLLWRLTAMVSYWLNRLCKQMRA